MPIRQVLQLGDPRLRERALPVTNFGAEIDDLIQDLADTLAYWRSTTGYGRGIAAPQLGVPQRVIFLKLPDGAPWPLLNPEITRRSQEKIVVWGAQRREDCRLGCVFEFPLNLYASGTQPPDQGAISESQGRNG